ncbi:MAG: hypothetical protein ACRELF_15100 [Gemmataceae bacterium]
MISIASGLIAVVVFIFVVVAYAGSGGGGGIVTSEPVAKATPGQPVDSDFVFTSAGNQAAPAGPTVQPLNPSGGRQPAPTATPAQPVQAPSVSAPQNPFTAGIH